MDVDTDRKRQAAAAQMDLSKSTLPTSGATVDVADSSDAATVSFSSASESKDTQSNMPYTHVPMESSPMSDYNK